MYLTQKCQLRDLSKQEFLALRELCRLSKNLYNVGLYSVRQFYFSEQRYLRYESNYHHCKENENYKLLNTDIAQQTLKVVDRSFRSFFNLIKAAKQGLYRFEQIRLPGYLPKGRLLPIPERLNGKKLKEVRILPKYNARFFEVEYIVEAEVEPQPVDAFQALAIDLGLDNLAACVSTIGASFIVDGLPLKAINQWFNKENARLQSIKDLQGIKGTTERQARLTINRNNRVRDYLNKAARYIVNWCVENKVGTVIVGVNPGMKQEINIGGRNNQNFIQIPHWSLRNKLRALCERYGLIYQEQEESYTSKASFLDGDDIPIYNPDNPQEYKFSGKRVKRGLYKSRDGHLISSDCNGAANIGKKSSHNGFNSEWVAAVLAQPLRVKIS